MAQHTLPLVYLQYLQQSTKGTDGVLATYILAHLSELPGMPLTKLAENAHVSYASACRFFKKMGLSGYRELKTILADESTALEASIPEALALSQEEKEHLSFSQINQQIRDFSLSIIESCCRTTSPRLVEEVCRALQAARSVYFVGQGTSATTAQYAYSRFFRLKWACDIGSDPILAKMKAALLQQGDLLFAVSSSGRTKSILEMAQLARGNGATVISLCDYAHTPLAEFSDISLFTSVRESAASMDITLPLLQGQITIINILYASLHHMNNRASAISLQQTLSVISNDRVSF